MYITIGNIIGEKGIDLIYPIRSKEVAVVSMFSDNIQYWIRKPLKVMLLHEEVQLPEGVFMDRELNLFILTEVITLLDVNDNIMKMNKLRGVTEMVLSLNKLNNSDNLEDGKPSNALLTYHVTDSEGFTSFKPISPQYKKLKNGEFTSLNLRIIDQKGNRITVGPRMTMKKNDSYTLIFLPEFKMEHRKKVESRVFPEGNQRY